MEELKNKYAIDDFNFALNQGAVGFYIITASAYMHRRLANSFISDSVAVYDYSGKENADTFSPKELFYFIENNNEKGVFFILNFQIPFLGKQADTTQPDYFALNLCRDILYGYNKKIFFFTTEEIRRNISIAAMDFYDYCFSAIAFKDEQKDEIEQQIKKLNEDYDNIHNKVEIEYRLNLYQDKIDEYLNIDIDKYSNLFIENVKTLTPEEKKSQNYLLVAARDLFYFGRLYEKIGDFDKALELYKKDLDIQEKINGKEHNNTANFYGSIGNVYALQGDDSQALEYFQKALKIHEKAFGNKHPNVAISYNNIGYVYDSQSDYSKALEYYQKALKIDEKAFGNEHPNVAIIYNNIGYVYYSQGDYSKALEYFQKALKIQKKVLGSNHPKTINTYNAIEKINSKLHHIS